MPLLDKNGHAIVSSSARHKRANLPPMGEQFGSWSGSQIGRWLALPGGGVVQFNLDALTLADYRAMLTHYQINSSLSVLSFMLHQSNYTIECDNKRIANFCAANLDEIWTQLNRAMSQAHWAGYSPNVLQWENDQYAKGTVITKIKDLTPETCVVNWDFVDGHKTNPNSVAPKIPIYDGIRQLGWPDPIPASNSFWYPILMENGDYYGKKLLKAAYTSYFFSMLMHLFANRYYERFGEPTPVGRAPFGEQVSFHDGSTMTSENFMLQQLQSLRNRSIVVLPSDRGEDMGHSGAARGYWEYDLEYLESQMRGADFERYMQRLDEEISLAIFTPVLLMKTADVGSYNLGVGHMQMYLWMLNAINSDRKTYIDKYILSPLVDFNFGPNAPRAKIKFNKLDNTNPQLLQMVLQALIGQDKIQFDTDQLGEMAGLTISEVQQTKTPTEQLTPPSPEGDGGGGGDSPPPTKTAPAANAPAARNSMSNLRDEIIKRVSGQVENAFKRGTFNENFQLNIGHRRRFEDALVTQGIPEAERKADAAYTRMDFWAQDQAVSGVESAAEFIEGFTKILDLGIEKALA